MMMVSKRCLILIGQSDVASCIKLDGIFSQTLRKFNTLLYLIDEGCVDMGYEAKCGFSK